MAAVMCEIHGTRASGHHKTRRRSRRVLWRLGGPRAMYFTHHGKPWLKPIIARPLGKIWYKTVFYFTQMKSTTTAIDDSNRRRNKLGLCCSREATAPLILIFKSLFLWLNIGRHFKGITQFHNCHSPKHTSKKYYLVINIFCKICTKIIT